MAAFGIRNVVMPSGATLWLEREDKMVQWVITYKEGAKPQRIYAFSVGGNNHLVVNYWDGTQWKWADQGTPSGSQITELPGVITYLDGNQRIYAFGLGSGGHLYVNYWNGTQWAWADQGTPSGTTAYTTPSVVTYPEAGQQLIFAFLMSANNHLHVNYWNGTQWKWADQGMPSGTMVWSTPAVITYYAAGKQRIYAFIVGKDDHLYLNYWNGTQWKWADQGKPPGTTVTGLGIFKTSAGVITYLEANKQRIYAFVAGANGHLLVNFWDGTQWAWADQGTPSGATILGTPAVITYLAAAKQRIYAFVPGSNGHLYVNYWNGTQWKWADQGKPAGTSVLDGVTAITYLDGGTHRIYAFAHGTNGHVIVNYWNGTEWKWADQGAP